MHMNDKKSWALQVAPETHISWIRLSDDAREALIKSATPASGHPAARDAFVREAMKAAGYGYLNEAPGINAGALYERLKGVADLGGDAIQNGAYTMRDMVEPILLSAEKFAAERARAQQNLP